MVKSKNIIKEFLEVPNKEVKIMNGELKLCAGCGRSAKGKINVQLVSGTETVTHTKKNGTEQTIKKPNAEHSFDVCEDCFTSERQRINRKRPWMILLGIILTFGGLYLAVMEIKGFINGNISLWIDMGSFEVMPYIAVIVAIIVPLIPLIFGVYCLKYGFSSSLTLVTEIFGNKLATQIVDKLKENDKDGRYFACTKSSLGENWTLEIESEAVQLESPCKISLTRESGIVGITNKLRIFLNGIEQDEIGNGKIIEMQTNLSKNILAVVDKEDNSKTLEFEAKSDGHVHILLKYIGLEMTIRN